MTPTEFDALTRRDFEIFVERVFTEVSPGGDFSHNFHLDLMAMKLEAVRRGELTRLVINIPPRGLKSIIASVAYPAWLLGHNPSSQIMCVSYGQELAEKFARDCKLVVQSPWYQNLFPRTRLSTRTAVYDFETTEGGQRFATSIGGVVTGRGADVIIIDDPMKPDDAFSETARANTNEWLANTAMSRLNNKVTGAVVLVMQRLHEDDMTGRVLDQGGWEHLCFPAIADEDETHVATTSLGTYVHERRRGEALHPDREPLSALVALRRDMGSVHFNAQYQQNPSAPDGGMINLGWFGRYDDPPTKIKLILESWDTGFTTGPNADYSACITIAKNWRGDCYVLEVYRQRLVYPDLKKAVKGRIRRQSLNRLIPLFVVIEDHGAGTSLIQDLRSEGYRPIDHKPKDDKVVRMVAQTAFIEKGKVFLPNCAPWLKDFERELAAFPNGRHDDQVDALSQALHYLAGRR